MPTNILESPLKFHYITLTRTPYPSLLYCPPHLCPFPPLAPRAGLPPALTSGMILVSSLTVSPVLLRQLAFPSHALPLDSASLICGKEGGTKVTCGAKGEQRPSGSWWETHFAQEWTQFTLLSCASGRVYCIKARRRPSFKG